MKSFPLLAKGVDRLKSIRGHIQKKGSSGCCPSWALHAADPDIRRKRKYDSMADCNICRKLFPKLDGWYCPCDTYEPRYLIKRLTEIIEENESA